MDVITTAVNILDELLPVGEHKKFAKGTILKEQYSKVNDFYILLEGTVHFTQVIDNIKKPLLGGQSESKYTPIGMDAFIPPYRNETTAIVQSDYIECYHWEVETLNTYLEKHPSLAIDFFNFLNEHAHQFVIDTSKLFANTTAILQVDNKRKFQPKIEAKPIRSEHVLNTLKRSPFFEIFNEATLIELSQAGIQKSYPSNSTIVHQGESNNGLYLLESGKAQYARTVKNAESSQYYKVPFRDISTPGYLLSTSSLLGLQNSVTTTAINETTLIHINQDTINTLCKTNTTFAIEYKKRILWLINNQLRAVRTRLLATQYNDERLVVNALIESNKSKLSIRSALHKIPQLLKDKLTASDAIAILHNTELNGIGVEKNLASLCLDNLHKTQKEADFYSALHNIYTSVTEQNDSLSNDEIQVNCINKSKAAFSIPSIHLEGLENLPKESGCVFIYNHLLNDPYYTLPNEFQITLDSHFLSALIYAEYEKQVLRVVRFGKNIEYGHENYYSKLGFINVFTKDSETLIETAAEKQVRRKAFSKEVEGILATKKNIIISPEGQSLTTEESPTDFKSGIFRTILEMDKEPLIVPIVMANFDKRITDYKYACAIKKPFYLTEKMDEYKTSDVRQFLDKYKETYRKYIHQLQIDTLAENSVEQLFKDEIINLKRKVHSLKSKQNVTAFYGSSTLRLWEELEANFQAINAINLGFGGSSYKWCLHYFDYLYADFKPTTYVLYGGDNDLSNGQTPQEVTTTFSLLCQKIKSHTPEAVINVISIKQSPSRAHLAKKIIQTNQLLKQYAINHQLNWVEINAFMINNEKNSNPDLFIEDMLHLNEKGYEIWQEQLSKQLKK